LSRPTQDWGSPATAHAELTPAELRTLQLAQEMPQAIDLRQRVVALGDRGIALRPRRRHQRMQHFDVGGKLSPAQERALLPAGVTAGNR
jgi:hypothetical protein